MDPALEVFIAQTNRSLDRIEAKVAEVERQVVSLRQWKWKIDGASILISTVFSVVIAIATVLIMVVK